MYHKNPIHLQTGFSLIEMAVVLVIIGLMIGGLLPGLSTQAENSRRTDATRQLQEIRNALIGFAIANDRLPCPATGTSNGEEAPPGGGACTVQHGFLPMVSLGLQGAVNADQLLTDPWNNPYRYSVTDNAGNDEFTTTNALFLPPTSAPDIVICDADSGSATDCIGTSNKLTDEAVAIVISMGKNNTLADMSVDELENIGEGGTNLAGGGGRTYLVPNNRVFVKREYGGEAGSGTSYDDLATWISPYQLYYDLVQAGQLP